MLIGSLGLAFLAGVLSILSPCVLPLLPIVLGAAASEHRWGPVALASGVTLSFIAIGLFVATIGFALGYDAGWFRNIAAIGMIFWARRSDRKKERRWHTVVPLLAASTGLAACAPNATADITTATDRTEISFLGIANTSGMWAPLAHTIRAIMPKRYGSRKR